MTIAGGIVQHDHSGATQGGAALNAHCPPGTILWFGHANQPATAVDWLECNGQNVSRATYAALFALIGTTWGTGDGSTTFTLPDMRRRVPVGKGGVGTGTLGNAAGNTGGAETTESHAHANDINTGGAFGNVICAGAPNPAGSSPNTRTYGTGTHGVIQPSAVGGYWVKT